MIFIHEVLVLKGRFLHYKLIHFYILTFIYQGNDGHFLKFINKKRLKIPLSILNLFYQNRIKTL